MYFIYLKERKKGRIHSPMDFPSKICHKLQKLLIHVFYLFERKKRRIRSPMTPTFDVPSIENLQLKLQKLLILIKTSILKYMDFRRSFHRKFVTNYKNY